MTLRGRLPNVVLGWCCLYLFHTPTGGAERFLPVEWLGRENLAPNGDFESIGEDGLPSGWNVPAADAQAGARGSLDTAIRLTGARSLKMDAPAAGTGLTVVSTSIPVSGETTYFVSLAFRQEGFNISGARSDYQGVNAYVRCDWSGAGGSVGQPRTIGLPYGPGEWDIRDEFIRAPQGADSLRISIRLSNHSLRHSGRTIPSALWLDSVQVREYDPPPTPDWAKAETTFAVDGSGDLGVDKRVMAWFLASDEFFRGFRDGAWSEVVTHPQAERGSALQAKVPGTSGMVVESTAARAPRVAPGLYRVRANIKIPAAEAGAVVGNLSINSQYEGRRLLLPFVAGPETSADFAVVEGDFILRPAAGGYWHMVVHTVGTTPWLIDSLKVFCLHELADRELMTIYPGNEGHLPPDLVPPRFEPVLGGPRRPLKGLMVAGAGYERYRIAEAFRLLHRDPELQAAWAVTRLGGITYTGLPEDSAEYFQYSIVFLCNVSLRGMTLRDKYALHEYVKRGGALMVFGGHQAYERGSWRGSLLEEVLPVRVGGEAAHGLLMMPQGKPLRPDAGVSWLSAFSDGNMPLVYFVHRSSVRPEAQVAATAGGSPLLVGGEFEKGRAVCFMAPAWGDPPPAATGFWEWDHWIYLLRDACWWAMGHIPE